MTPAIAMTAARTEKKVCFLISLNGPAETSTKPQKNHRDHGVQKIGH